MRESSGFRIKYRTIIAYAVLYLKPNPEGTVKKVPRNTPKLHEDIGPTRY
ncbi:Hypothetical protein Cp262_2010 [Corynebacterium pseudotuberculosis]|nr:Hypothetical protein Cp262_2010 [Corynebacterium pseudotuberculosis]